MTVTTPNQRNRTTCSTSLDLETTRPSASTGTLELAALALDVGLLSRVGTEAKVLESLTRVLGSAEEEGVGSGGGAGSDLVNGEALTTSLLDASASRGSEAESRNRELGELEHAVVVSDGADNDDGLALVGLGGVLVGRDGDNLGEGDGGTVGLGHHEAAQNRLVEGGIGAASQELVQTHQQLDVGVGGLGDLAVPVSNMVAVEVNSHLD